MAILVLPDALADAVEAVRHDAAHDGEVGGRAEAAGGQVALVLHGLVAADGRHVLGHGGRTFSLESIVYG